MQMDLMLSGMDDVSFTALHRRVYGAHSKNFNHTCLKKKKENAEKDKVGRIIIALIHFKRNGFMVKLGAKK